MSAYPPPVSSPAAPEKKSPGCFSLFFRWIVPLLFVGGILFMGLFLVILVILGGEVQKNALGRNDNGVSEKILRPGAAHARVAVIRLEGEIMGSGGHMLGEGMVHDLAKKMRAAAEDDTVGTVLLDVDSPGGGLTASDILYNEVQGLRKAGKKVVAAVGSLAASGGYYVIAPADRIFVQPTGMVGSFGVIMQHFELTDLLKKVGVKVEPLKSTGSKDIGSMFRPMTEPEKAFFAKILNTYHGRFVKIIADGRNLKVEKVEQMANGELYTAEEAVAAGLADKVGYFDDALAYACSLAGHEPPEIFTYEDELSLKTVLEKLSGESALGRLLGWCGTRVGAR